MDNKEKALPQGVEAILKKMWTPLPQEEQGKIFSADDVENIVCGYAIEIERVLRKH